MIPVRFLTFVRNDKSELGGSHPHPGSQTRRPSPARGRGLLRTSSAACGDISPCFAREELENPSLAAKGGRGRWLAKRDGGGSGLTRAWRFGGPWGHGPYRAWLLKVALFTLLVPILAGCSGPDRYYPLAIGQAKSYNVRTGFLNYVETITPTRVVSVAGSRGFELSGPLGVSRVAWKNQVLMADRLANAAVNPPVPLLAPDTVDKKLTWSGTLTFPGGKEEATATLTQSRSTVTIGGRKFSTVKAMLVFDTPKRQIELDTQYAPGVGPVQQEQRTNDRFDLSMELLAEK